MPVSFRQLQGNKGCIESGVCSRRVFDVRQQKLLAGPGLWCRCRKLKCQTMMALAVMLGQKSI